MANPFSSIPIERPFPLSLDAKEAIRKISQAGHRVYVVGGAIRDHLLGREVKDIDLATSALPDEVKKILPASLEIGKAFGVMLFRTVEIATFRTDGAYTDFRHPEAVRFSTPEEDAKRRDFTVNALFFDSKQNRILDSVGGVRDLKTKILKTVGNPDERFQEDSLRILRAIRFSSRLGFRIEDLTWAALLKNRDLLLKISFERIRDEMTKIISGPSASIGYKLLIESGILDLVAGEVASEDDRNRSLLRFGGLDTAKRKEFLPDFFFWALVMAEMDVHIRKDRILTLMTRLRFSKDWQSNILRLLEEQSKFRELFAMREASIERWIRSEDFSLILEFQRLEARSLSGNMAAYKYAERRYLDFVEKGKRALPKWITGTDLLDLGLSPGPKIAEILREVEDESIEGRFKSREDAITFVIENYAQHFES